MNVSVPSSREWAPRAVSVLWLLVACRPDVSPAPSQSSIANALGASSNEGSADASPAGSEKALPAEGSSTLPCSCEPLSRCVDGGCEPACPADQVWIAATGPSGYELRGGSGDASARGGLPDQPPHRVVLTHPFCIDATEVTVRNYRRCVDAGACSPPKFIGLWNNYPDAEDHPVNKVDWRQAKSFCEFANRSLPTEAQWEWAATGGDGRPWPWGDAPPTCEHAQFSPAERSRPSGAEGCRGGGTIAVGTLPMGDRVLPSGRVHDLAGNVWEWCLDSYVPFPRVSLEVDPLHLNDPDAVHVVRGGGWNRSARGIRSDFRGGAVVGYQVPGLGFRCVTNAPGP